ncbi:MAG: hypothetical protein Kow0090_13780 [Myxococcota bacterium]
MKKIFTIILGLVIATACGSLELDTFEGVESPEDKSAGMAEDDSSEKTNGEASDDGWQAPVIGNIEGLDEAAEGTGSGDNASAAVPVEGGEEFYIVHGFKGAVGEELKVSVISLVKEGFIPRLAVYNPKKELIAKDGNKEGDDVAAITFSVEIEGVHYALVANAKGKEFKVESYKLSIECLNCGDTSEKVRFCAVSAECKEGEICTTERKENPECLMPPDCKEGDACAAVCYGRCVVGERGCECEGAEKKIVCGENGKTYANECLMECDGVEKAHDGECEDSGGLPDSCWEKFCDSGEEIRWCTKDIGEDGCPSYCECSEPIGEGMGCDSDKDCPEAYFCSEEERCAEICFSDEEGEKECEEICKRICLPKAGNLRTCLSDADCAVYESCEYPEEIRDVCLPPPDCESGGPCPDVCAGVCISHEQKRVCYSTGDCAGGELCSVEMGDCFPPPGCDSEEMGCPAVCTGYCVPADDDCNCYMIYAPVCGVDGRTYGNDCVAKCEGVAIAYPGECKPEECVINCLLPDPVCGVDGETYWCGVEDAKCHGVEVAYKGECRSVTEDRVLCLESKSCPKGEICSLEIGRQDCFSNCDPSGGNVCPPVCMGECLEVEDVACTAECERDKWAPAVCTGNGEKFKNACFAFCHGYIPGEWKHCW